MIASMHRELDVMRGIARQAGEIALRYWQQGIAFESKSDLSPVTQADRECEQSIVRALEEQFPDDGIMGEEGAMKSSRNGRRWIVDPIDGTRDFVRGNPVWGMLIGLEADGEVIAGCAYLPALGQMFFASRGGGAYLNDRPIRVSAVASPEDAVLCMDCFNRVTACAFGPRLLEWLKSFWAVRSMGGCLDAMMVARGQADLWIEPSAKPWDLAPLKIIAQEAGGRFFDFKGESTIYGGNCVICTPGLEKHARDFFCR